MLSSFLSIPLESFKSGEFSGNAFMYPEKYNEGYLNNYHERECWKCLHYIYGLPLNTCTKALIQNNLLLELIVGQSWLSANLGFGSVSVCLSVSVCVCACVCLDRNRTL